MTAKTDMSFDPQLSEAVRYQLLPNRQSSESVLYPTSVSFPDGSITDAHVDAFISAKTDKQLTSACMPFSQSFLDREIDLERPVRLFDEVLTEARECQSVLLFALKALEILSKEAVTYEDLDELGMPAEVWNERYLMAIKTFEINVYPYQKFLFRGCHGVDNASLYRAAKSEDDERSCVFQIICGEFERENVTPHKILATALNALFTVHMIDVRSICIKGNTEKRVCLSGLSSIWWTVLSRLREGRVGVCETCGRPFVTKRERGKKRRYCNEACRQRAGKIRRQQREQQDQSTDLPS